MIGLVLIAGVGLVFLAAFWWALPRDLNPGISWWMPPFRRGGLGAGAIDVDRDLRRAREAQVDPITLTVGESPSQRAASWMELPGAFGDDEPREPEPPRTPRPPRHRDPADDLPSAADIARFGGEPDFGEPNSTADENAEDRLGYVAAEGDENSDLPDEDDRRAE